MVVVVGLKSITEGVAYSLTLRGPRQFNYDIKDAVSNVA